jgi:thymidylate kinase
MRKRYRISAQIQKLEVVLMLNTRLILIDGMPGSGKTTTGQLLTEKLKAGKIPNRFIHELAENHPLRIYDRQFTSFTIKEEAEWFSSKVKQLFRKFVLECLESNQVTILEAYVFQNTIGFAFNMGMELEEIEALTREIQDILSPLNPVLIYYYQTDVEQNWRWICNIRGPVFTQERCGLYTDEDFVKAGEFWTRNQNFVYSIVQEWPIPKLIIENKDYRWNEYIDKIFNFLEV